MKDKTTRKTKDESKEMSRLTRIINIRKRKGLGAHVERAMLAELMEDRQSCTDVTT